MSELFPIEAVSQDSPRLAWMKRVKAELRIATHYADGCGWMAVSMNEACAALAGYDLTDDQKNDLGCLIEGFGRLLDEANFLADDMPTEEAAIEWVAIRHGRKLWNEEGGA